LIADFVGGKVVGGVWSNPQTEPHEGPFAQSVLQAIRDEEEGVKTTECWDGVSR
jgi:hypothetical protein